VLLTVIATRYFVTESRNNKRATVAIHCGSWEMFGNFSSAIGPDTRGDQNMRFLMIVDIAARPVISNTIVLGSGTGLSVVNELINTPPLLAPMLM